MNWTKITSRGWIFIGNKLFYADKDGVWVYCVRNTYLAKLSMEIVHALSPANIDYVRFISTTRYD